VGQFMKYVIETLKFKEKDILYEKELIEVTNEKGEKVTEEFHSALSVRFIMKCLSVLNTRAAKNWVKLDAFLEVL
jgi:hypothetical protein